MIYRCQFTSTNKIYEFSTHQNMLFDHIYIHVHECTHIAEDYTLQCFHVVGDTALGMQAQQASGAVGWLHLNIYI